MAKTVHFTLRNGNKANSLTLDAKVRMDETTVDEDRVLPRHDGEKGELETSSGEDRCDQETASLRYVFTKTLIFIRDKSAQRRVAVD